MVKKYIQFDFENAISPPGFAPLLLAFEPGAVSYCFVFWRWAIQITFQWRQPNG